MVSQCVFAIAGIRKVTSGKTKEKVSERTGVSERERALGKESLANFGGQVASVIGVRACSAAAAVVCVRKYFRCCSVCMEIPRDIRK